MQQSCMGSLSQMGRRMAVPFGVVNRKDTPDEEPSHTSVHRSASTLRRLGLQGQNTWQADTRLDLPRTYLTYSGILTTICESNGP
jgi:hypothetical protein